MGMEEGEAGIRRSRIKDGEEGRPGKPACRVAPPLHLPLHTAKPASLSTQKLGPIGPEPISVH